MEELGPGTRAVFPRREGLALPRPRADGRQLSVQPGPQDRCARRGGLWEGPLDLRGTESVAAAPVWDRRRVSVACEPHLARQSLALTLRIAESGMRIKIHN